MDAGIVVALLGAAAAAYYDIRCRKIPNVIPAAMLLASFPLAFLGNSLVPWLENIIFSTVLLYLFWMLRVWAAGDSKLLIGIAALMPQYPTTVLQQPPYGSFFFLTVIANLLLVYLLYATLLILRRSEDRISFAFVLGSVIILFAAAYERGFMVAAPFLFSFLVFRTYSEAAKLDLARTVLVSELNVGDNLAERIFEKDGRAIRENEAAASVSSLLRRLVGEDASSPRAYGVTKEEKDMLRSLVASGRIEDRIRIYSGAIMSPMILAALCLSVALGDVLAAII